jgi:hypothetical protein
MQFKRIKNYIWNKWFEEDKANLYRKAFEHARDDLKETNVYNTEERANELADEKLDNMLSVVNPNFIVRVDKQKGMIFIGEEKADQGRLTNLKAEAEALTNFELWKLLYETPKELAERAMFIHGESLADMQKGKSMLYTLATQKNIIDTFLQVDIERIKKPPLTL